MTALQSWRSLFFFMTFHDCIFWYVLVIHPARKQRKQIVGGRQQKIGMAVLGCEHQDSKFFNTPNRRMWLCQSSWNPKILWHLWYPIVYRCLESSVQFSHYRFLFLLDNREDFPSAMTVPKEVPIRAVMSWPVEALMAVGQVWISARWVVCRKF